MTAESLVDETTDYDFSSHADHYISHKLQQKQQEVSKHNNQRLKELGPSPVVMIVRPRPFVS